MKRSLLSCMMVLLVLIAACGCVSETEEKDRNSTSTENVSPEIHTWLQEHAIPFDTVEPGGEYEDLMPLKEIIGDARIVALGEATHGTSEFFKTKHRMLEFLVNEMDFNLFAIEDSCLGSNMINNYVHTGEGDPEELLAGLSHWPWNTQEVLDMIKWMRKHNENLGNAPEVSFFGFDPQKIFMAMDKVIEYLEMIDPEAAADVKSLYSPFRSFMDAYKGSESLEKAQNFLKIPLSEKDLYKENVRDVYALLEAHQSEYESLSSPDEFAFALQSARIVLQIEDEFLGAGPTMREAMRDKYMAENVEWILEQAGPDAKIVLWAHNGHIQEGWVQYPNTMCTYLREKYGNEMVTFGFTFYKGSFNACDWDRREQIIEDLKSGYLPIKVYHFEKPLEYNYGYYFHSAGFPYFFLDLRDVRYTKTTYWLFCCTHRGAGAVFSESWPRGSGNIMSLAECFDVTIYIQEMTPSQLLER